ncbi:permease prefix domain 1-containing protein [Aeromicrobium terrae]|uniref:DUF4153 domain-containing protein n=1 Tax=Aeromicrobium terrae TaxID=2498846 RepID=A0A5C8NK95_9ACTN|nr:permease prefix domain 1-containing protein [Aeromicrobium terrae]TXL62189.1 hypothetical protein FHP06_05675 [Aeromicrobium terrae]
MTTDVETQISEWRQYVQAHPAIVEADVDEMEEHLREQIADLTETGLGEDEAFLIAVKRMGNLDAISHEFAREHSERLWKQLVLLPDESTTGGGRRTELWVALGLGVGAAISARLGIALLDEERAAANAGLLVLPFLAAFFVWKRQVPARVAGGIALGLAVLAVVVNVFPFDEGGSTQVLTVIHAPIVAWFLVGVAYVGGDWTSHRRRMDFVRFTGEWFVYYVLLALGGGVLVGLTVGAFSTLGHDPETVIGEWVIPFGAAGAVLVAAWLVEAKQAVVENIAPVLTRIFTPLSVLMLLAVLGAFVSDGSVLHVDRDLLILMALILVLVLGLLLYAISARDPRSPVDAFDWLQLALVVSAILVDAVVLVAMLSRIAEFGASANKVAALGLNLLLLGNLLRATVLGFGFTGGREPFGAVERWQTTYLPLYAAWAAAVVVVLPPAFGWE